MSERTHSPAAEAVGRDAQTHLPPQTPGLDRTRRLTLLVGGTAVALLAAGVLFQFFRAEPGEAGIGPDAEQDPQPAGRARVAQPLARVNGQLIGWQDVAEECVARYGKDVLDNIVNRTIIQQACEERGVVVTNAEVNAEILRIAQKFKLSVDNWYQMLQQERNLSPIQYRRDIIWPMLALKKIAGTKTEVSEKELQEAFVREYGPRVEAKMIMLDNFRRAQEVHSKAVANPDDFGRLAQKYSVEPTSKALGGAIPPIRRHSGSGKLEEIAFKLKKGDISPVIQVGVNDRWVILLCEGHTEPVVKSLDEVRDVLYEQLLEEKVQESVARIFSDLKRQARVDNFLTNTSTGIRQASGTSGSARTSDAAAPKKTAPPKR